MSFFVSMCVRAFCVFVTSCSVCVEIYKHVADLPCETRLHAEKCPLSRGGTNLHFGVQLDKLFSITWLKFKRHSKLWWNFYLPPPLCLLSVTHFVFKSSSGHSSINFGCRFCWKEQLHLVRPPNVLLAISTST